VITAVDVQEVLLVLTSQDVYSTSLLAKDLPALVAVQAKALLQECISHNNLSLLVAISLLNLLTLQAEALVVAAVHMVVAEAVVAVPVEDQGTKHALHTIIDILNTVPWSRHGQGIF
jgi:hypothetical protein